MLHWLGLWLGLAEIGKRSEYVARMDVRASAGRLPTSRATVETPC
jgi:hypothetical protein